MAMMYSTSTDISSRPSRRKSLLRPLLLVLFLTMAAARGSVGVKGSYERSRRLPVGNIFYPDEYESPSDKYGKGGKGKGFGKDKKVSSLLSHGKGKAGGKSGGYLGFGKVGEWLGVGKGKDGKKGKKYGFNPDGSKCVHRAYASSFVGPPKLQKTKAPTVPTVSPAPTVTPSPTKSPKVSTFADGVKKTKAPTPPTYSPAPTITASPTKSPKVNVLFDGEDSSSDDGPKDKVVYPYCKETYPSPTSPTGGSPSGPGGEPTGGSSTDGSPTGGTPTGSPPTDGTPSGGPPTDGTPSGGPPTDSTPTGGPPTDSTPTDGPPTDGSPTDGTPTDSSPTPPNAEPGAIDCAAIAAGTAPTSSPVVQYNIDFDMSLTGNEDDVIARLEEFLQQVIAPLLAGCGQRRRLDEPEATINNAVFKVKKDTDAEPFCNTCTSLDVETDIYYSPGSGASGFRDLLYNTIVDNCDAIRALEGVDQTFNPCLDLVITGPYDNDLDDGGTFEGDPDSNDTGVAGATREVSGDGGLTTVGGLAVALGGLVLILLAVLFVRKQRDSNSSHLKHQYLDEADMDGDDDTDVASTNPSPARGMAFDIASDKAIEPFGLDESMEIPTNAGGSFDGSMEGGTITRIALNEHVDNGVSSIANGEPATEVSLNDPDEEPSISSQSWPSAVAGHNRLNPRLAHVVGEDNSIMSSWSFYNDRKKSKGELDQYDLSKDPRSGLSRIAGGTNVHKCSSATCEICEAQRQSGLQFVPVAMPGYSHESLPEESQRVYLAEDTVQL